MISLLRVITFHYWNALFKEMTKLFDVITIDIVEIIKYML